MVDLGNVEDRIRQPKTPDWQIELANFNVSRACQKLRFKDTISQPGEFNIELMAKPADIEENDNFLVFKNSETVFSGLVRRPENSSSREDRYQGQGPSAFLKGVPITEEYKNADTDTIVDDVFSQISTDRISVGVNEQLNSENASVDVRADDEGALNFLNRVIMSHGGEWNTTYNDESGDFEFNVYERLETAEPVKEFRGGNDESNIRELNDKKVFDKEYDAVIVKGYGDGDDQVSAEFPARSQWPDDPEVLKHTDKTVFSEREAETKAENIYNDHLEWRNIELVPANNNEVLNLGDLVSINEDNTGISGEFRVVQRKLNLNFGQDNEIKYVLSDRPINMVEEITDVQEQTKSETDYMQGSRNVWGEKETANSSSVSPLEIDFEVPSDVLDKSGSNKISNVYLNYACEPFRQSAGVNDDVKVDIDEVQPDLKFVDSSVDAQGVSVERSNIKEHRHAVASNTARAAASRTTPLNALTFLDTSVPSSGFTLAGIANMDPRDVRGALSHDLTVSITDISETSDLMFAITREDDELNANFVYTPDDPVQGDNIEFYNTTEGGPAEMYYWSFGDGSKSFDKHPEHVYDGADDYTVDLSVWASGNTPDVRSLSSKSDNSFSTIIGSGDLTFLENEAIKVENSSGAEGIEGEYFVNNAVYDSEDDNTTFFVNENVDFDVEVDIFYPDLSDDSYSEVITVSSMSSLETSAESLNDLESHEAAYINDNTKMQIQETDDGLESHSVSTQSTCEMEVAPGNPDESNVTQFVYNGDSRTVNHTGSILDEDGCADNITVEVYGVKSNRTQFEGETDIQYEEFFDSQNTAIGFSASFDIPQTYDEGFDGEFSGPSVNKWRVKVIDPFTDDVYADELIRDGDGFPRPYYMVEPSVHTNILSPSNNTEFDDQTIDVDWEVSSAGRFRGLDIEIEDSDGNDVEDITLLQSDFAYMGELQEDEERTITIDGDENTLKFLYSSSDTEAVVRLNGVLTLIDEGETFAFDNAPDFKFLNRRVYNTSNYEAMIVQRYESGSEEFTLDEGDYTIKLVADHEDGDSTIDIIDEVDVSIVLTQPPEADFNFSPESANVFETIEFEDLSTPQDEIVRYEWSWGDGTNTVFEDNDPTQVGPADASKSYDSPGMYDVTLEVENTEGETDSITKTVEIIGDDVEEETLAFFSTDSTGSDGLTSSAETQTTPEETAFMDSLSSVGSQQSPAGDVFAKKRLNIPYREISSNYNLYIASQNNESPNLDAEMAVLPNNHDHLIPRQDDFENLSPRRGAGAENREVNYSKAQEELGELVADFSTQDTTIVLDTTLNGNDVTIQVEDENGETEQIQAANGTAETQNTYNDSDMIISILGASNTEEFEVRDDLDSGLAVDAYGLKAQPADRFISSRVEQDVDSITEIDDTIPRTVIEDISDDILEGQKAESVKLFIDTDPESEEDTLIEITNDVYGEPESFTDRDNEIDISEYIDDPGWYKLIVEPQSPSFVKSRVFIDHYKDGED